MTAIVHELGNSCISLGELGQKLFTNKLVNDETADSLIALSNSEVNTLDQITALTQKIQALNLEPAVYHAVMDVISTMHKASKE